MVLNVSSTLNSIQAVHFSLHEAPGRPLMRSSELSPIPAVSVLGTIAMCADAGLPDIPIFRDVVVGPLGHGDSKVRMSFAVHPRDLPLQHYRHQMETPTKLLSFDQVPDAERIDGPVVYGGPLFLHFGHFVSESLHRAWARLISDELRDARIVFHTFRKFSPSPARLPKYMRDAFSLVGIAPERILYLTRPLLFSELHVPPQGRLMAGRTVHPAYRGLFERFNIRLPQPAHLPQRLYISRLGHQHSGSFYGEAFLHRLLGAAGFTVLAPEKLSVLEMVSYLRAAKHVVFAEGSAVHLLELCGEMTPDVFVIGRRSGSQNRFSPLLSSVTDRWFISEHIITNLGVHADEKKNSALVNMRAVVADLENFLSQNLPAFEENAYRAAVASELLAHLLHPGSFAGENNAQAIRDRLAGLSKCISEAGWV